jgi:hypothetical protein
MNQVSRPEYRFRRPIIIVAAPRSGSTLLFETFARAKSLWTIGDESHMIFERIDTLNPLFEHCTSNRLLAADADAYTVDRIRASFLAKLQNADGIRYRDIHGDADSPGGVRLLEKTPKNSLRIPFLNEVFPDALYIYLYRDPRENLSSIIEAWCSEGFITYSDLADWAGNWSLLLPPEFQQMKGKPLEEIVAFQWQAANRFILDDLEKMPRDRWTTVSFAEFVNNAPATIERLCSFADVPYDEALQAYCSRELPLSRYTTTAPKQGKWRMNQALIEPVLERLGPTIARMEAAASEHGSGPVLVSGAIAMSREAAGVPLGRNERCPCGSGLRFKHCHGTLSAGRSSNYGMSK